MHLVVVFTTAGERASSDLNIAPVRGGYYLNIATKVESRRVQI
jgi:hypothetical protein